MVSIKEVRQELAEAKVQLQKVEDELKAFNEGEDGLWLAELKRKLWNEEGTEAQRADWKKEKNELAGEKKELKNRRNDWSDCVRRFQDKVLELTTQPGCFSFLDSISSIASVGRKRRIDKLTEIAESNKKQKVDGKLAFSVFGKASTKVFDAFGLDQFGPDRFKPPSVTLPDSLVNKIFKELKVRVTLLGSMISGKERKRERFIDVFLFRIAEHVGNVKILLGHELNGIEVPVNGNVEYVMMVEGKIILLLEAKADDFAMGRAQNYVECEVGYELNCNHQSYIYGIVTNSTQWYFNRLDGDSVKECLGSILLDADGLPTKDSIRHVSCIIAGIIEDMKKK